jgi:putative addiction module antidote
MWPRFSGNCGQPWEAVDERDGLCYTYSVSTPYGQRYWIEVTIARKISRSGNSVVFSLPAEVLEAVGLELGDEVIVTADPEQSRIIIAPLLLPGVRRGFLERIDRLIDNYQQALETLAQE